LGYIYFIPFQDERNVEMVPSLQWTTSMAVLFSKGTVRKSGSKNEWGIIEKEKKNCR